ncbi:MAG: alpha/beta fold hydrolase [Cyanobacteria bacterium J06628_6]
MSKNPVVLVHGLWNTVDIFWQLRSHLTNLGWDVYGLSMTPNNGDIGIDEQAHQLRDYIHQTLPPDQTLDIVGFSMGGLVSRYYLQQLGGLKLAQRFVSVATPHYGSVLAWTRRNVGGRQMRPGSRFLRHLNQDRARLETLQVTTIWTPLDMLVIPATSCRLSVGQDMQVLATSHNSLLREAPALDAITTALSR